MNYYYILDLLKYIKLDIKGLLYIFLLYMIFYKLKKRKFFEFFLIISMCILLLYGSIVFIWIVDCRYSFLFLLSIGL